MSSRRVPEHSGTALLRARFSKGKPGPNNARIENDCHKNASIRRGRGLEPLALACACRNAFVAAGIGPDARAQCQCAERHLYIAMHAQRRKGKLQELFENCEERLSQPACTRQDTSACEHLRARLSRDDKRERAYLWSYDIEDRKST